jgi:hypothetical protein
MNTTGDMNRIVAANSAGSGNSGSQGLIVPPASPTNVNALTMVDKGMQWIGQIRMELNSLGVPFNISTDAIHVGTRRYYWDSMVPVVYADGCLHWHTLERASVYISHSPQHIFHAAVVAMHELGHLHMDSKESNHALWTDHRRWGAEFKLPNEVQAWNWAKQKMGGDWTPEAEHIALHCLASYGIEQREV